MVTPLPAAVSTMSIPRNRIFLVSVFLVLSPVLAVSQERRPQKTWLMDVISAPSRGLDPGAVYQPAPHWSVAVSGDLRQAGISQKHDFDIAYAVLDDQGNMIIKQTDAYILSKLQGSLDKGVGFQVGYGNLSLGWNQKVGGNRDYVNRTFSFDYLGAGYAVQLQYFDFELPIDYEIRTGKKGEWNYQNYSGKTDNPGRMKAFIADAFYAFNRRTFSYSAVYKGNMIQRRSAGTCMFGAKLIGGMVENDPFETIAISLDGLYRQTTRQVSFGGGFSYNFVPFHRQPGEDGKGLRNLTFNVTAIPMVTLFNQFSSFMYDYTDEDGDGDDKTVMNGNLLVNYVARAGVIYSWERFFTSLSASYDSYSYTGKASVLFQGGMYDRVRTAGHFERWTVALKFCVKF